MPRVNPTKRFQAGTDPEYGSYGLRMKTAPDSFNYAGGVQVAHDILEHFPNDDGSVVGELQALGASLYVRNFDEYYANKGRKNAAVEYQLSGDLPTLLRGGYPMGDFANAPRSKPIPDFDEHKLIENTLGEADEQFSEDTLRSFGEKAVLWIRRGYWRAKARYKKYPQWKLLQTFINIEKTVDKALKQIEGYGEVDVSVYYDIQTEAVRVVLPQLGEVIWST